MPAPSELVKYPTISDGVGPHSHDGVGPHEHGDPSFTDAEVKFMESRGWHIDRHHGIVYGSDGGVMPPLLVGTALQAARREGLLPKPSDKGDTAVAKIVSGPNEAAPVVDHLDLRQQP